MSDLPVTPPPEHPNDYPQDTVTHEVPSNEKTRPLMGHEGQKEPVKREEYTGR